MKHLFFRCSSFHSSDSASLDENQPGPGWARNMFLRFGDTDVLLVTLQPLQSLFPRSMCALPPRGGRRARPGRGAMATASIAPAAHALPDGPTLDGLAARAAWRCTWFRVGRKTVHRGRLCLTRPATRPCAAFVG